jgi:hypothetical protein
MTLLLDEFAYWRDTDTQQDARAMINQRNCPFCKAPAAKGCEHLAMAAEGRDFIRRCVEACQGQQAWNVLCHRRQQQSRVGGWVCEQEDFTWLETAFCEEFLRHLTWFGGMDHEWRSGPRPEQGGFWVLLWSKNPQRLWWELREELEREGLAPTHAPETPPWLIWLSPK